MADAKHVQASVRAKARVRGGSGLRLIKHTCSPLPDAKHVEASVRVGARSRARARFKARADQAPVCPFQMQNTSKLTLCKPEIAKIMARQNAEKVRVGARVRFRVRARVRVSVRVRVNVRVTLRVTVKVRE